VGGDDLEGAEDKAGLGGHWSMYANAQRQTNAQTRWEGVTWKALEMRLGRQ